MYTYTHNVFTIRTQALTLAHNHRGTYAGDGQLNAPELMVALRTAIHSTMTLQECENLIGVYGERGGEWCGWAGGRGGWVLKALTNTGMYMIL